VEVPRRIGECSRSFAPVKILCRAAIVRDARVCRHMVCGCGIYIDNRQANERKWTTKMTQVCRWQRGTADALALSKM
jgi:hypothetical protein